MNLIWLSQVKEKVSLLEGVTKAKVYLVVDLLELKGARLSMPFSKPLGEGLFELRTLGGVNVRIFYCFRDGSAYLLHVVVKKQNTLPVRDIRRARAVMRRIVC